MFLKLNYSVCKCLRYGLIFITIMMYCYYSNKTELYEDLFKITENKG